MSYDLLVKLQKSAMKLHDLPKSVGVGSAANYMTHSMHYSDGISRIYPTQNESTKI